MRFALVGFTSAHLKTEILFKDAHISSIWTAANGYTVIQSVGERPEDASEVLEKMEDVENKILGVVQPCPPPSTSAKRWRPAPEL